MVMADRMKATTSTEIMMMPAYNTEESSQQMYSSIVILFYMHIQRVQEALYMQTCMHP